MIPGNDGAGEEVFGVECAGRFVLMFEVDEDIALLSEGGKAFGEGVEFEGRVAAAAAQAKADETGGGVNLWGEKVFTFGDTEGSFVLAQNGVDLFAEPGDVAELKCNARCVGRVKCGNRKKGSEQGSIGFEVWWKLKEQKAQLACLPDWFESGDELRYIRVTFAQTFEMGNALRCFEAEAEVGWSGGKPVLEHLYGRQRSEGVIDLDRGELRGVELKKLFCGSARRVKVGLPRWISPTRGSGINAS